MHTGKYCLLKPLREISGTKESVQDIFIWLWNLNDWGTTSSDAIIYENRSWSISGDYCTCFWKKCDLLRAGEWLHCLLLIALVLEKIKCHMQKCDRHNLRVYLYEIKWYFWVIFHILVTRETSERILYHIVYTLFDFDCHSKFAKIINLFRISLWYEYQWKLFNLRQINE